MRGHLLRPDSLVTQDYWDDSYRSRPLSAASYDDQVRKWIERHVPPGSGSCIEIGCFPGRYLAVLGELGYELNGIDLTPRVETDLPRWLRSLGYRVGEFHRWDAMETLPSDRTYDVVCSFGFLEHFREYSSLLRKHADLVGPGGCLLVSAPNFAGALQRILHWTLDRQNLERHYLPAMNPRLWAQTLADANLTVTFAGWFGPFDFWVDRDPETTFGKSALRLVNRAKIPLGRILPEGSRAAAPWCGVVAHRGS